MEGFRKLSYGEIMQDGDKYLAEQRVGVEVYEPIPERYIGQVYRDGDFPQVRRKIIADLNKPEPAPVSNNHPAVWDMVIADMQERDRTGLAKYGTRLQPFNGRDPLVDAYQEVLDLAVYLRQEIEQRKIKAEGC
jgi:hypothetical protein